MQFLKKNFSSGIEGILKNETYRNILNVFIFSTLTSLFGMVRFQIPGVEGISSELGEIPLLISILYFTNPMYLLPLSFVAALRTPPGGSVLSTFIMHAIALIIIWYLIHYIRKSNIRNIAKGIGVFVSTFIYYLVLVLPLMILTHYFFGLNLEKKFIPFYLEIIQSLRFEMVATASIFALYIIQHEARFALRKHLNNLEILVHQRTIELEQANEILKSRNLELFLQKEELYSTLKILKNTQSLLIHSEKMASMGTLTAGIAHEINNPLNYISGGIAILDHYKTKLDELLSGEIKSDFTSAVYIIRQGLERVNNIVESVLSLSRNESSGLINSNINNIIETTLLFLNFKLSEDIKIIKNFSLDIEIPVFKDKMIQVFFNILDNAIFEVSRNSNSKPKEISIKTNYIHHKVRVEISNTGAQLTDNQLKHIFDPFYTDKDPGKGKGLGLFLCYSLMQEHNGTISVSNNENGVVFTIEIPTE